MRKSLLLTLLLIPAIAYSQTVKWQGPSIGRLIQSSNDNLYTFTQGPGGLDGQSLATLDPATGTAIWTKILPVHGSGIQLYSSPNGVIIGFMNTDTSEIRSFDSTGSLAWSRKFAGVREFCSDRSGFVYSVSYGSTLERFSPEGTLLWSKQIPGIENTLDLKIADASGNYCGFTVDDYTKSGKDFRKIGMFLIDRNSGNVLCRKSVHNAILLSEKVKGSNRTFYSEEVDPFIDPMVIDEKVVLFAVSNLLDEKVTASVHKVTSVASMIAFTVSPSGSIKSTEFKSKDCAYVKSVAEKGTNSFVETQMFCGIANDRDVYLAGRIGRGSVNAPNLSSGEFHAGAGHSDACLLKFDAVKSKFSTVATYPDYNDQIWCQYIGDGHLLQGGRAPDASTINWAVLDLKGKPLAPADGFQAGLLNPTFGTYTSSSYFVGEGSSLIKYDFSSLLSKAAAPQTTSASKLPTDFLLEQNYPNPFNPTTAIRFALPVESQVQLTVYNTLGQLVTQLIDGIQTAGEHSITWDAANFPSGVYLYRIEAVGTVEGKKTFRSVGKMILTK